MVCSRCKTWNRPGALFCDHCGTALTSREGTDVARARPSGGRAGWVFGGVCLAVLLVVLAVGAYLSFIHPGSLIAHPAPTATASPTLTPSVESSTPTLTPNMNLSPSLTLTFTPAMVMFTPQVNAYCRLDPDSISAVQAVLPAGVGVQVVGKLSDFWLVHVNRSNCWVWTGNGTTSGDPGQFLAITTAPTLTPTPEASTLFFILVNNSDQELCDLYFSADGTNWGADRLEGTDRITAGSNNFYTLPGNWAISGSGAYRVYYRAAGCSAATPYEKTGMEEILYGGNLYINY